MMRPLTTLRAAAVLAVLGAMALAGCGGGSSQSMLPTAANAASSSVPALTTQNGKSVQAGTLSFTVPTQAGAQAQSSGRSTILSTSKKPTFIDTTTPNSTIVVSVSPQNPAEAAQYGNLTVCYNLYTNGTLAAAAPPNFTYTTSAPGVVATVTIAIPAPPGTDGYQITQYAGQCGSTPYTIPTPPPTNIGTSNILSQTPLTYADIEPGVVNNLNNQIANCPAQTVPCPLGLGAGPGAVLAASVSIASVAFGAVPITNPIREQGAFLLATGKIGVPVPLEAQDASGAVIPGLTTIANPNGGAGPFPSGVTVTTSDTVNTSLFLVDATTGAIAQNGPLHGNQLVIHEFNALSGAVATGGNDLLDGGTAGDPWVIVLAYNGKDASVVSSVTVTATATAANAALPTPIKTVISPQSTVFTAGGTGYADLAAPAAPVGLISAAGATYFTDGAKVKIDGTATASNTVTTSTPAATITSLTALTYTSWGAGPNNYIYAVDNGQAGDYTVSNFAVTFGGSAPSTEITSGVYAYNPATLAVTPVSASGGAGGYFQFANPVGVAQAAGSDGKQYLYVVDKTGNIFQVDISNNGVNAPPNADANGFQAAAGVAVMATTGTALSPGTAKYLGSTVVNGAILIADPGNNRIATVNTTTNPPTIGTYATGAPFTGVYSIGSGALYATSTSGQIYYISGSGATAVSLGLTTGGTVDGPVGQLSALAAAPTGTLTPVNYPLQFQSGSFFDSAHAFAGVAPYAALAAPYTIAPFPGGKAFAAAPAVGVGLIADTSAGATTGAGKVNATGGIILVPTTAAAAATVTPDSLLFVDGAGATGKLRTLVR